MLTILIPLARGNQLSEYFSFSDVVNYNPKHVALRICLSLLRWMERRPARHMIP